MAFHPVIPKSGDVLLYNEHYLLSTSVHYVYNSPGESDLLFFWSKESRMKTEKL